MSTSPKLSPSQLSVLHAALAGQLRWAFPVLSGGGFFIRPSGSAPSHSVRSATAQALLTRHLIRKPVQARGEQGGSGQVELTPAGIRAIQHNLSEAQKQAGVSATLLLLLGCTPEETRRALGEMLSELKEEDAQLAVEVADALARLAAPGAEARA